MNEQAAKAAALLKEESSYFLNFHKSVYPMFHNSNVFARDVEYSILRFLKLKGIAINERELKEVFTAVIEHLTNKDIFTEVSQGTWRLNYTAFKIGEPLTYDIEK